MKFGIVAFFGLLLIWCAGSAGADIPDLEAGFLYDGANILDAGPYSVPEIVDWNNDGKKDLLVGCWQKDTSGLAFIYIYLNQGTNLNPVFNGGVQIQSGGAPIIPTYG